MIASLPPTELALWLLIGLVGVVLSFAYSGTETGLYRLSEVRLRVQAERAGGRWRRLQELMHHRDRLICTLLIGNNLVNYATTASAAVLLTAWGLGEHQTELYTTLVVAPILFVTGEMIPKTYFRARADTVTVRWTWLLSASRFLFTWTGILPVVYGVTAAIMRLCGHRADPGGLFSARERIRAILLDHTASGVLSSVQLEIARNVLDAATVTTADAMQPISRVVAVAEGASRREIREAALPNQYSRLLVHAAGNRANLIGHVDVTHVLLDTEDAGAARRHMQPVVPVRGDQTLTASLQALQQSRCPIGVVRDARGRTVGIVTAEDLVNVIVGEPPAPSAAAPPS